MFAMERTDEHIRVWFWSRDEVRRGEIPSDLLGMGLEGAVAGVSEEANRIDTDNWVGALCESDADSSSTDCKSTI